MIEINLLPDELKVKSKKEKIKVGIDTKYFLYLLFFVFGVLLCVHIYLAFVAITKNSKLSQLKNRWQELAPERKKVDAFKKEYALLTTDAKEVKQLLEERINWAEKLNKLSLELPSGIWFNEISISPRDFILNASAVSLQKGETSLIKQFIDNLKNDTEFYKDFKNLELSSIQRRKIGGYDIVDFTLIGTLNLK